MQFLKIAHVVSSGGGEKFTVLHRLNIFPRSGKCILHAINVKRKIFIAFVSFRCFMKIIKGHKTSTDIAYRGKIRSNSDSTIVGGKM